MSDVRENKKIPAIRFMGFSGDWEVCLLGKNSMIKGRLGWKSLKQSEYLDKGPSMIAGRHIVNGVISWDEVDHIPEWRYIESPEIMLKENDVIFSKDGSLGNPAIIKNLKGHATINSTMMLVRPNKNLNSNFFYQVLNTSKFAELIKLKVSGSSIPHLFQADMNKFCFSFTSIKEQTKIGNYFQQLDTLIAQHQQKHEKLQNLKKALLEKCFPKQGEHTPELRFKGFSGAWEEKALGDVTKIKTGNSNREDSGLDGKYTFFDRSEDIRTSNIFLFDCEAVIVAGEGSDFIPKYFVGKFDLHQRTYAVMDFRNCDGKYLFYYIHFFRKHFLDYAVGSTVKSLRLPMFEEMPIQVPKKVEQTKIGKLFQQLDTLINQQQTQLGKLKNIKQACLEKMFV